VPFPLPTRHTDDVETKHGQRSDHDHTGSHIDPIPQVRSKDDRKRPRAEVESQPDVARSRENRRANERLPPW